MRRAVPALALAASLASLCLPVATWAQPGAAQSKPPTPDRINGIGLIDFGVKPTFKVGDWAKYHMSAKSALGVVDDYNVTVLIGGEEDWWGEEAFWIETWTESATGRTEAVASLMSYEVFRDSLALPHMQMYVRKIINGIREDGTPEQQVYKRPASTLKMREVPGSQFKLQIDTLGTETITVPKGTYECRHLHFLQGRGAIGASGDSTDYTELREDRNTFMSERVPITHIVREDIEQRFTRKAWKVGHSQDATPTMTLDRTLGSAQLIDSGSGLSAQMVPKELRRSLAEQRAAAARPPAPKKTTTTPPKKKTG
jgi:hypothetical protein